MQVTLGGRELDPKRNLGWTSTVDQASDTSATYLRPMIVTAALPTVGVTSKYTAVVAVGTVT